MLTRLKQPADRIAGYAITTLGALALVGMTALLAAPTADAQGRNKADWDFGSEELNQGQSRKLLRDKDAWEESVATSGTVTVTGSATTAIDPEASSCADFFAGQDILVGEVCVSLDSSGVQISYELDDGFGLHEVHAWAGTNLLDMPQTGNGNPRPGRFPASATRLGGSQSHSVTIPLSELVINPDEFCGSSLYVAAHAALTNGESAWAGTEPFTDKGNWGTYFAITVDCGGDESSLVCYDLVPVDEETLSILTASEDLNIDNRDGVRLARVTYSEDSQSDDLLTLLNNTNTMEVYYYDGDQDLKVSYALNDTDWTLKSIHISLTGADGDYISAEADEETSSPSTTLENLEKPETIHTYAHACMNNPDNPS